MYVTLSHQAWTSVSRRVPTLHAERMKEHRLTAGNKAHRYELPAIAWRQVLDCLLDDAFGVRGGKSKENPQSFYTALRRIQSAVSWREHHPALEGRAIYGQSTELMLAFYDNAGRLQPYPNDGGIRDVCVSERYLPEMLVPWTTTLNGHVITEWMSASDNDVWRLSYSLVPENHYEFIQRPMA